MSILQHRNTRAKAESIPWIEKLVLEIGLGDKIFYKACIIPRDKTFTGYRKKIMYT